MKNIHVEAPMATPNKPHKPKTPADVAPKVTVSIPVPKLKGVTLTHKTIVLTKR